MSNEEFFLKQAERQNGVIDTLLKENGCLKTIIATCLLQDKGMSEGEKELIGLMVGNSDSSCFHPDSSDGNSGSHIFHNEKSDGNSGSSGFLSSTLHGNSGNHNFFPDVKGGNSGSNPGNTDISSGIDQVRLAGVMARLTPMMKTAPRKTIQNTAVLLFYWQANPATAPAALRNLTGLSPGGMAKRVMAMKKAGLIVRYNHPLRYALTEKACEMLNGALK